MQDNAPAHTPQVAMAAATECGFEVLPHPPDSPDMAPSDFFYLFPKLKSNLRGRRHSSSERINLEDQEKDYYLAERISKLEQRWTKCIALKGNYIEN